MHVNKDKHLACETALFFLTVIYGSDFNTFDVLLLLLLWFLGFKGCKRKKKATRC